MIFKAEWHDSHIFRHKYHSGEARIVLYCFPYNREVIMNQLGNEFVSLSIDETGALTELCNRKSGRNLVCPHSLVRLILGDSGCLELEAVPAGVPDIRCGEDRITLVFLRWSARIAARFQFLYRCWRNWMAMRSAGALRWRTIRGNRRCVKCIIRFSPYVIPRRRWRRSLRSRLANGLKTSRNRSVNASPGTWLPIRSISAV